MEIRNFRVKAMDRSGGQVELTVRGVDANQVQEEMARRHMLPVSITEEKALLERFFPGSRRLGDYELIFFFRQLMAMVSAGITIGEAVNILADKITDNKLRGLFGELNTMLSEGRAFSYALEKCSFRFPPLVISFVYQGEHSSDLAMVFGRLITYWERKRNARQKLIDAMIYPAVLMVIVVGMLAFLLTAVVPTFTEVFADFSGQLPLPTRVVISVSDVIREHFWIVLAGLALVIFTAQRLIAGHEEKVMDLASKLPLISSLVRLYGVSYFSLAMGSLLKAGMSVDDSLAVLLTGVYGDKIARARVILRGGRTLRESLETMKVFNDVNLQMITVGENTGKLSEIFQNLGEFYETELDYGLRRLLALFEPLLILSMGVLVGFIVLAMFLPIIQMAVLMR
ncbi:MAG: type II secretion system F family protein [Candidatus Wallbacteria bacterium]|nr:type II secretion system F family protein [Candidatus Wallbacteria bacterium]